MSRPLRRVPWIRPPAVYRPSRRVSPVRQRGVWTLRPDNWMDAVVAWIWPRFREVIAAAIFATAGFLFAWWALS